MITSFRYIINVVLLILPALIIFSGCATSGDTPPPTLTPDKAATAQSLALANNPTPTASPIPPPSPTPTRTPFPILEAIVAKEITEEIPVEATKMPTVPSPTATPPNLENSPQAEILSPALNIRQSTGLNAPVLRTAFAGDVFNVTGRDPSGNWLQITTPDGESGWISAGEKYTRLLNGSLDELPVVEAQPVEVGQTDVDPPPNTPVKVVDYLPGKLVFATSSGGDLYIVNLDGTDLRRLAGGVIDPALSPDGKHVAFTRWDGAEFGALTVLKLEDGSERVIVGGIRQPKSPTWSPDGNRIVISFQHGGLRDPVRHCRTFEPGQKVRIPDNVEIDRVKVRPDGKVEVCFTPREDLQWRLRRVEVSSGEFEDLPSDEYAYSPTWDPQNPWRVIYSGNKGLMQFDVNNNQQAPITTDLRDTEPVFSPDGTQVAITYKQHDHWEIYTLNLETGVRERLTKPPILADPQYNSAAPAWSPDGSQIAFLTDRSGQWEIWVMNADGSEQRPLLPPATQSQLDLTYNSVNERLLNWFK